MCHNIFSTIPTQLARSSTKTRSLFAKYFDKFIMVTNYLQLILGFRRSLIKFEFGRNATDNHAPQTDEKDIDKLRMVTSLQRLTSSISFNVNCDEVTLWNTNSFITYWFCEQLFRTRAFYVVFDGSNTSTSPFISVLVFKWCQAISYSQ